MVLIVVLPTGLTVLLISIKQFSTLFRTLQGNLLTLVTDEGFPGNIVWESLQDTDQGSATFFDSSLTPIRHNRASHVENYSFEPDTMTSEDAVDRE